MALVAPPPRGYTRDVTAPAHDTAYSMAPEAGAVARRDAPADAPGTAPTVWIHAEDPAGAAAWCQALALEGLTLAGAGEDGTSARAVVLHCRHRVQERLALLRELRALDSARPLIVVGHALRDLDQVLALEMGADDVIDASVSAPVVAARLRALWRRGAGATATAPERLAFGRLALNLRERSVRLDGQPIDLTECEFEVLWLLALQAGRAVSRADLLQRLRGLPYQRIDRSIDCRIYRIRAKLRDGSGAAQHIRTVRNCGYLFSPARW